ncbi:MAG: dihydrodipicolinate synthase family protein [Pseudomonadota bacterium]
MSELKGIFAAMCTPFDESGEHIDEGRYTQHIDEMIEAGLHGLVLCSGTGEYAYLRDEEKNRLIELGAKHVNGRVPTVAQTTALSTADAVEKSRMAEDAGASAVMVLPPFLEAPGEKGVIYHYEAIAKAISIPVVMYNVPEQSCVTITPELYRKLIAIENLDYIKDSSCDFIAVQKLIGVGGNVLCGIDALAPYSLMAGCVGMIWGAANFMPHECARLYDLIADGKHTEALELWDTMTAISLFFGGNVFDVDYLTGVKAAARLTGRDMGPCRKPLPPVPGPARNAMRMAMAKLPYNSPGNNRLVWRDWEDERDWLIQSYVKR